MNEWNRTLRLATKAQIQRFERRTGLSLPPLYKNYLLKVNGGEPAAYCGFLLPTIGEPVMLGALYGISDKRRDALTLSDALADYEDDLPSGFLPIGEDPGGNLLLVAIGEKEADEIYYWDRDGSYKSETDERVIYVAPDIDSFLSLLRNIE